MKLSAIEVIQRQAQKLGDVLASFIAPGQHYALLDFPDHSNVGDSAIWLGEVALLGRIARRGPGYVCKHNALDKSALREAVGESGVIFLHGGGNFGDIYPVHQTFRERVVEAFPSHRIVQLPQSIKFRATEDVGKSASIFGGHRDFHLLVRDHNSLSFAKAHFGNTADLVPDSAFGIGLMQRTSAPTLDEVLLLRTDEERASYSRSAFDRFRPEQIADWIEEPGNTRRMAHIETTARAILTGKWSANARRLQFYNGLAHRRVKRGVDLLSQGQVVITDRLHGHIISTLLDIPNVILDNDYGKVRAYAEAWTADYRGLAVAESAEDAVERAAGFVRACAA